MHLWNIAPLFLHHARTLPLESLHTKFGSFQSARLKSVLPELPIQYDVLGSIFQTAYYFVDLHIGAPESQSISVIVDTGSSTQGIPCNDCKACGQSHWEQPYDRNRSLFNERMPCGECATCRLTTANDTLKALAKPLANLDPNGPEFTQNAATMLLYNPDVMQCLYNVHYAEGSSLAGLFYNDVIWLNGDAGSEAEMCPAYPRSSGPAIPLLVPLGCHIEETHLFYEQKASGILGLEFWGSKGVPTFPTAVLDALDKLYSEDGFSESICRSDGGTNSTKFQYAFSLCLAEDGGVMSFGGTNRDFHLKPVELGSPEAAKYRIPLISDPTKPPSYLVGLTGVRITKNEHFSPYINSSALLTISDDREIWEDIELNPGTRLEGHFLTESDEDPKTSDHLFVTPTLIDSGTTLSFMPPGLFKRVLDAISDRVAANSEHNNKDKATERRLHRSPVTPEMLFGSEVNGVVTIDKFSESTADRDNVVEFIPLTSKPLLISPKRLIKLSALDRTSIVRSMKGRIYEAFVSKQRGRRRLQDANPSWYAVLEPVGREADDQLLGFLDIPGWMEPAQPRTLVSKLEGYNNGECWWLQDKADLKLFPVLGFQFVGNVTVNWHPSSYMYSGTNDHFWCLAIMTEGGPALAVDTEVIFGSNSFVHHDMVFSIDRHPGGMYPDGEVGGSKSTYRIVPEASVHIVPAVCPKKSLDRI